MLIKFVANCCHKVLIKGSHSYKKQSEETAHKPRANILGHNVAGADVQDTQGTQATYQQKNV